MGLIVNTIGKNNVSLVEAEIVGLQLVQTTEMAITSASF